MSTTDILFKLDNIVRKYIDLNYKGWRKLNISTLKFIQTNNSSIYGISNGGYQLKIRIL